ncbi:nucleotidyltransferase family protein [Arthrobacter monumenti]
MPRELKAAAGPFDSPAVNDVLPVAAARAALPGILRRFRVDPDAGPVFVGSHRKTDGVIVPMSLYRNMRAAESGESVAVLDFIRQRRRLIARLAALSHLEDVAVFGSAARGEENPESDVDFLVGPDEEASLFDLAQFAEDMEQLLARPVDVVSRRGLDAVRDREILAEAVTL